MKQLAAFASGEGSSVVVEIDDGDPGYDRVARSSGGKLVADTGKQLGSAFAVVRPTADALMEKVDHLAERPEKIEVQFGVRLNAEVGAVIASTRAEGHLEVTLTWTNSRSSGSNGS